jgi:hypothetical protein
LGAAAAVEVRFIQVSLNVAIRSNRPNRARRSLGILFAPGPSEGKEVSPGVILHFDAANRIVEIEILSASERLAPGALTGLPLPAAAE